MYVNNAYIANNNIIMIIIIWLRTNGVNTNGAAARVMNVDRFGKKVTHWHFGKSNIGEQEYPKSPSVNKHEIRSGPISADPFVPF